VCCFFWLIDAPALSTAWLDADEMRFLALQQRIKDGGDSSATSKNNVRWDDIKMVLTDWRLYLQSYIMFCAVACSYGMSPLPPSLPSLPPSNPPSTHTGTKFTLPTLTRTLVSSTTRAQLLTAPPYLAGALVSLLFAWLSDRFNRRLPFVAVPMCFIFVGYSIIMSYQGDLRGHTGPALFAIVLTCMGIYPSQTAASAWAANNLAPASRRAVGVAFNFCVGSLGGVVGSFMYLESEKPVYDTGFGLSLAFGATGFIVAFALEISYMWGNSKRAKMSEEEVKARYTDMELLHMGNKSPLFRYTL
jgi:MFS family permease